MNKIKLMLLALLVGCSTGTEPLPGPSGTYCLSSFYYQLRATNSSGPGFILSSDHKAKGSNSCIEAKPFDDSTGTIKLSGHYYIWYVDSIGDSSKFFIFDSIPDIYGLYAKDNQENYYFNLGSYYLWLQVIPHQLTQHDLIGQYAYSDTSITYVIQLKWSK